MIMSMNSTPSGERVHIGFFGRRNAGKSSVVNAVTGQDLAVVSDVKGTTTDPVKKAMELLPLGPVMIIDTPGADTPVTLLWLAKTAYPELFADIDILEETKAYYREVFGVELTDTQAASIFAPDSDAGSGF